MTTTQDEQNDAVIPVLFRYFMAASLMQQDFDRYLTDPAPPAPDDPMFFLADKSGVAMCLWYGMLFVVVEGWQGIPDLDDPEIDRLLQSNVYWLRHFRTGTFHFQWQWLPAKLTCATPERHQWVRALMAAFRRRLMAEMQRINSKTAGAPSAP
jgi:hypothetical protein